ncbi:MAG TPA: CoA transferase, partial [Cyclobacteriaceae bacterium]|nr:CoA transferase [Cyclobacteriaceae bacterium]
MFKNLNVLELASVLAGPAVGQFFAELGAEVIKIENLKTGGD